MKGTAGASIGKWSRYIEGADADPSLTVTQNGSGLIQSWVNSSGTTVHSIASTGAVIPDDALFTLGTGSDIAIVLRSTALGADTALANVLLTDGSIQTPALTANSLIISNVTENGEILFATRRGDNSIGLMELSGQYGRTFFYSYDGPEKMRVAEDGVTINAGGTSIKNDFMITGQTTDQWCLFDVSAEELKFAAPTTISTSSGNLTLNAAGDGVVLSDSISIGAGQTPAAAVLVRIGNITFSGAVAYGILSSTIFTLDQARSTVMAHEQAHRVQTTGSNYGLTSYVGMRYSTVAKDGGGNIGRLDSILLQPQTIANNNSAITILTGWTAPAALADAVQMWTEDITGGDARFGIQSEAGAKILIGNNALQFAAAATVSTTAGALTLEPYTSVVFNSVNAGITANPNSTQGDSPITKMITQIATSATAGDVVTLPPAVAGAVIIVMNDGAENVEVFPASGDNINEAGTNARYVLDPDKNAMFIAHDAEHWSTILTA